MSCWCLRNENLLIAILRVKEVVASWNILITPMLILILLSLITSGIFIWPGSESTDDWIEKLLLAFDFFSFFLSLFLSHQLHICVSLHLNPFCHCSFSAVPQLGGTRRAPASVLAAGQPGQQQCSGHQLPSLSERHICGGQNAPTRGQVWHLQRSHGEAPGARSHL